MGVFNKEKMIKVCNDLGVEIIEGNIPMLNDKPLTEEDMKNIFNKENYDMDLNLGLKTLVDSIDEEKVKLFNGVEMSRSTYMNLFGEESYNNRKKRGKIISFEGTDGCFKETNSKRLYEYLKGLGLKVTLVSFPRYEDESSIFIRRYLNGEYENRYDNIIGKTPTMYMYALDRYDYIIRNNVRERLEEGEWFIFDRYVESNLIYENARLVYDNENDEAISESLKFIEKIVNNDILEFEYLFLALPKPDIVIALYSDYDLTMNKILSERETTDKNESDKDFMKCVFEVYDALINIYDWNRLNVFEYIDEEDKYIFKSKDQIFNEILELLKDKKILL